MKIRGHETFCAVEDVVVLAVHCTWQEDPADMPAYGGEVNIHVPLFQVLNADLHSITVPACAADPNTLPV